MERGMTTHAQSPTLMPTCPLRSEQYKGSWGTIWVVNCSALALFKCHGYHVQKLTNCCQHSSIDLLVRSSAGNSPEFAFEGFCQDWFLRGRLLMSGHPMVVLKFILLPLFLYLVFPNGCHSLIQQIFTEHLLPVRNYFRNCFGSESNKPWWD